MDLYRVGTPSIGEVWLRRFTSGRSSGGLGTGVYAFRDRIPAEKNVERGREQKSIYELRNALTSPFEIATSEGTTALVRLSRIMSMLAEFPDSEKPTYDEARDEVRNGVLIAAYSSGIGSDKGFKRYSSGSVNGRSVLGLARTVLSESFTMSMLDAEDFLLDFIDATEEAERRRENGNSDAAVQPINVLLYPEYDGVAPRDGAGGNSGRDGCVIFKQRIDECVGRETESFEQVDAETLNRCFADDSGA